jgi:hypothetical protein
LEEAYGWKILFRIKSFSYRQICLEFRNFFSGVLYYIIVRGEFLTAVPLRSNVFWDRTPCTLEIVRNVSVASVRAFWG